MKSPAAAASTKAFTIGRTTASATKRLLAKARRCPRIACPTCHLPATLTTCPIRPGKCFICKRGHHCEAEAATVFLLRHGVTPRGFRVVVK